MQTDTLKIYSFDALFTMFTTLEPLDRRMAVLHAIADPKTKIGHTWKDCIFAVAARAANHSFIKSIFPRRPVTATEISPQIAAKALNIPLKWVEDGITVWDIDFPEARLPELKISVTSRMKRSGTTSARTSPSSRRKYPFRHYSRSDRSRSCKLLKTRARQYWLHNTAGLF